MTDKCGEVTDGLWTFGKMLDRGFKSTDVYKAASKRFHDDEIASFVKSLRNVYTPGNKSYVEEGTAFGSAGKRY